MLGKCIKNEFVNRTKQALGIICTLVGMALFTRIIDIIGDGASSSIMDAFSTLTKVAYIIVIIAALVMTAFLPFLDFRQRFYKDQAYLTHTLPVKVSTMLIARMICDVVITIAISFAWIISLMIAFGENVYRTLFDIIESAFDFIGSNSAMENSLLIILFVLFVIGVCLSILNSIWMTNAAYSFGHAFSSNKKLFSVIGMVVLYTIEVLFLTAVMYLLDTAGIVTNIDLSDFEMITTDGLRMLDEMFAVMDIIAFLMVFAMGAITNFICKRHLNVE